VGKSLAYIIVAIGPQVLNLQLVPHQSTKLVNFHSPSLTEFSRRSRYTVTIYTGFQGSGQPGSHTSTDLKRQSTSPHACMQPELGGKTSVMPSGQGLGVVITAACHLIDIDHSIVPGPQLALSLKTRKQSTYERP
jgi:hypothetical protein